MPASAQTTTTTEYYVVQDVQTKKCTIMDKKPETTTSVTILGDGAVFKTRTDADTGMKKSRSARPTKRLATFFAAVRPPLRGLTFFGDSAIQVANGPFQIPKPSDSRRVCIRVPAIIDEDQCIALIDA